MAHVADYEGARQRYPAIGKLDERTWRRYFDSRPDMLDKVLREIYIAAQRQWDQGKRSTGRRVVEGSATLDELWGYLLPRYSMEPFPTAVREVMGGKSLRDFAGLVPMHHQTFNRFLTGERPVINHADLLGSMKRIEDIARAGKVHPAFFLEWRTMWVLTAVTTALNSNPNATIDVIAALQAERDLA